MHFPRRGRGDDRCDLLAADRNLYFRHQAADADRIDASHQLIASADPPQHILAFFFGFASRPVEQLVYLASGNAVVSPGSLDAANLLLVNPLRDGREADPKL